MNRLSSTIWALMITGTVLLGGARPCLGDIYRYVDAAGKVHFTNIPTGNQFNFYLKEGPSSGSVTDMVSHYSRAFGLEEALIKAVIKVESDFDPRAVSSKGAQGLMQLIPSTARELEVRNPFNVEENIRGGSRYLRMMLDQFGGNLDLALAAYNAGPGTVRRHGGVPPYAETRKYVDRVKLYLQKYRRNKDPLL